MKPYIYLLLFLSLFQTSCKKYLDEKPDLSLQVPSTLKDLQAILDNVVFMNQTTPCWDEASADNYYVSDQTFSSLSESTRRAYIWENTNYIYGYDNDWATIYSVVYPANLILDKLKDIERTNANADAWDNIKGSALVFRSQAYLQGVFIFSLAYDEMNAASEWGMVLRKSSDFNEVSVRSSVSDTYRHILEGLHQAANLLKDNPQHPLRPSKAAAFGYLARAYLSMRKYDSAYIYADKCLDIKNELMDFNEENIEGVNAFPSFNREVIFHKNVSQYSYNSVYPGYARADSTLYDSYNENDLRKTAYFMDMFGDGLVFKGNYHSDIGGLFMGIATDEMYITRAECAIRQNMIDRGLSDLNTLLENRWKKGTYTPYQGLDRQDALKIVLDERRKELIFRGLRWMDIKRLNKEGANIILKRYVNSTTYTLQPNDKKYALNLPDDVLSEYVPQNP